VVAQAEADPVERPERRGQEDVADVVVVRATTGPANSITTARAAAARRIVVFIDLSAS
jgi:hypothetical protein